MAFCKNCGEKLEDGTKFCPKCGNSIEVDCDNENPHSSIDNNGNEMTKTQKGVVWCAIILVGMALMSSLVQGNIISGMVAVAAIVALVFLIEGKIDKKYAWVVSIAAFLGVFGVLGATTEDKPSKKQTITTQKEATESGRQTKEETERQAREQKEETERQAREQKEDAERLAREQKEQERKDKILKEGYNRGYNDAIKLTFYDEKNCRIAFTNLYGAPQSDEDIALFKQYKEQYNNGWGDGRKVRDNM